MVKGKKVFIVLISIVLLIVLMYVVLVVDTNGLIRDVKDLMLWKVPKENTAGMPIDRYNSNRSSYGYVLGEAKISIFRYFVLHDFKDGYIWLVYTYEAYDLNGELITGSNLIPTKWKIHKKNGKWEIVEIFEKP